MKHQRVDLKNIGMLRVFLNLMLFCLFWTTNGCGGNKWAGNEIYWINGTIKIYNDTRTYLLNLPPGYYDDDSSSFPLVIGLHGTGGSASQFENDYGFSRKANSSGFIAVYPEGEQNDGFLRIRTWNAGSCCEYAMEHNVDDVEFISRLIDDLVDRYKVNPTRVYVTGMSNGGMLAYRLACEIPEKIAAIAVVSGTMVLSRPCEPVRPVPILHIHSALDTKVPFNGGIGIKGYYFPAVDSVLEVWSHLDACNDEKQIITDNEKYKFVRWSSCMNGTVIECYLTKDGGHAWPGGEKARDRADTPSTAFNATDLIWDFFQRFKLEQ